LVDGYDGKTEIPAVHDEWWGFCCSAHSQVAFAAPRGHAKSTAITLAYVLASVCLRYKYYVVIAANTEEVANDFLHGIRDQLRDNAALRDSFGIKRLTTDGSTNAVVEFNDGHQARIRTKGAGQKVRGMLWKNTRPDLLVIDDLEDDEAVESADRRAKLKTWLLKALFPCVSKTRGDIRIVGTILHNDSALASLMDSAAWLGKIYKAHNAFDDFEGSIWPEMWSVDELKKTRQKFIDMGDPEGYSQEYLNDPSDLQNPYFREEDFIPMDESDHKRPKTFYVGVDFALSDKTYSDYTVMVVGGYDSDGLLHIVDERRLRTADTAVVVDELFSLVSRWNPDTLVLEAGVIEKAILPLLKLEMRKRNKYTGILSYTPVLDKTMRANSIQQRMRTGSVRYDFDAPWFEDHRHELKTFPRGKKKDRVDAIAWLGRAIDELVEAPTQEDIDEDDWQFAYEESTENQYVDSITGY
jgi:predicted phage terminase large subunit-like protein